MKTCCHLVGLMEDQICVGPLGVTVSKSCKSSHIFSHIRLVYSDKWLEEASIPHAGPHRVEALQINSSEAVVGHQVMISGPQLRRVGPTAP